MAREPQLWELTRAAARRPSGDRPGRAPARARARAPQRRRRSSSSPRRRGSGIGCATSCSAATSRAQALLGLLPSDWIVGDLGCGTGALLSALAPHVRARHRRRRVGRDAGRRAHARRAGSTNVELRRGTLEALPIDDAIARRRDDDARAAPPAVARRGARRSRARAQARRPPAASSTWRRTSARSIVSRWATSGSDSPTTRLRRLLRAGAGFDARSSVRALPPAADGQGPGAVCRNAYQPELRIRARLNQGAIDVHRSRHRTRVRPRPQGRPPAVQGARPRAGRVGPQGNASRRAGDARPDGAARALRGQDSRSPARASWARCT